MFPFKDEIVQVYDRSKKSLETGRSFLHYVSSIDIGKEARYRGREGKRGRKGRRKEGKIFYKKNKRRRMGREGEGGEEGKEEEGREGEGRRKGEDDGAGGEVSGVCMGQCVCLQCNSVSEARLSLHSN